MEGWFGREGCVYQQKVRQELEQLGFEKNPVKSRHGSVDRCDSNVILIMGGGESNRQ